MSGDLVRVAVVTLWAVVASQHAFYAVGMAATQERLRGPAWVELRNALDSVLRKRLAPLYVATLVATLLWLGLGDARRWATVALAALIVEGWLMLAKNVPLNQRIQTWTPESHPADWEQVRRDWLATFRLRQVAIAVGFLSVVLGAVSR